MQDRPIIRRVTGVELTQSLKDSIDSFNDANQGTVFHETAFNGIASDVFGSELSYFIAHVNGKLAGICPCHSFRHGLVINSFSNLSSFEIPYGGWVYDSSLTTISKLVKHTDPAPNEAIHYTTSPEIQGQNTYSYSCSDLRENKTVVLKTSGLNSSDLLADMNHKQRNKINRSYKIGIQAEKIEPDRFDVFWKLFADLKARAKMPLRSRHFFESVYRYYYSKERGICLAASYEGNYISAMIVLSNANFTTAWIAGRQSNLSNSFYQNELLLWEAIKWSLERASTYFDFCGLDEDKLPHLARIKLSFSKDIVTFYHYSKKTLYYRILNRLSGLICKK